MNMPRTPVVNAERAGASLPALRRLGGYLLRQPGAFGLTLLCALCAGLLLVVAPWMIGRIIDRHVIAFDGPGLLGDCLWLLLVYAAAALFAWAQAHAMAGVAQHCVQRLRGELFEHLQRLPLTFFAKRSQGELMSRATHDLDLLATTLNQGAIQLLSGLVLVLGALAFMLALSPLLTLISVVCLVSMLFATRAIAGRSRQAFADQQGYLGELNGRLQENIDGQATLRLYGATQAAAASVEGVAQRLRFAAWRAQTLAGSMGPAMNTFNNLGFALIAAVGGWLVLGKVTSIGVVVAFLNYSRQLERPVNDLANQFNLMQAALAGVERTFQILDQADEFVDEQPLALKRLAGDVEFVGVGFHYDPRQAVLQAIDLHVRPGECVALVGPTGAGKTTLFNLLLRFIEPSRGHVRIDGLDIRHLPRRDLRRQLGVVLQDCQLFAGTLAENLRLGCPQASDEELRRVARLTGADAFISRLPLGYDSPLGGSGLVLSQGQRQLLAITRTLLIDPAILLLDEATSNIDARSEAQIQRALRTLMQGRTCLVIAHRLHTVRQADRIAVIDQGRVVALGTHEQLMAAGGTYARLHGELL